jgi:hypothetical protein
MNSTVKGFLELMSYYLYGQETPHFHDAWITTVITYT